jgi:paraquat-inducible protein B
MLRILLESAAFAAGVAGISALLSAVYIALHVI